MITQFEWWHLNLLNVQEKQKGYIQAENFIGVEGPRFTYIEDYSPKACFGMQIQWEGRAVVWAVIGDVNNWPAFHRLVKAKLDYHIIELNIRRCEMTTEIGFQQAERWAKMLGFKYDTTLEKYFAWGSDAQLWVRL